MPFIQADSLDIKPNMAWYENWFDTKYYHSLYQHRDESEAERLVQKISEEFPSNKFNKLCDAACGKGRHAKSFSEKGYDVEAFDLSANSIAEAKQMESDKLRFFEHDITQHFGNEKYDIITNLFTSFGYFDIELFDLKALYAIYDALNNDGVFIQDYLNANLVQADDRWQKKEIDGYRFTTKKVIEDNKVKKKIEVKDGDQKFEFQEQVSLFRLQDFEQMYKTTEFELLHVYGDYNFNSFVPDESPRLIMVSKKRQ